MSNDYVYNNTFYDSNSIGSTVRVDTGGPAYIEYDPLVGPPIIIERIAPLQFNPRAFEMVMADLPLPVRKRVAPVLAPKRAYFSD